MMQLALGKDVQLPRVAGPDETVDEVGGAQSFLGIDIVTDRHRSRNGRQHGRRSPKSLPEMSWCPSNVRHRVRGIESTDQRPHRPSRASLMPPVSSCLWCAL